ncbi:hypothetical protein EXE43_07055 [Halorubrum sp. SS5]|nr:hypothetical protein EXE43_07055 [Halorubrum sp. SS5]
MTVEDVIGMVRDNFGHLILLGGVGMTLMVVTLGFWAFLAPAVGILLGGIGSIFIHSYRLEREQHQLDWQLGAIGTSLYIIGIFAIYRPVIGVRPPLHYALHGVMAAFVAYQIFRGGSRGIVTVQIAVFAFFTFWSSQLAFPAGMYSPDTFAFIPAVKSIVVSGGVGQVTTYSHTPGHMVFVAEFAQITGLSVDTSYRFAATLVITGTVFVLAYADQAIPGLSRRTALLATLIFVLMSYSIAKGSRPTKLNFFYPLIPLIALSIFKIKCGLGGSKRYLPPLFLVMVYLIFAHTYSGGAALIVSGVLWLYLSGVPVLNGLDYSKRIPVRTTITFGILCIMYLSYTGLVTGEMIGRIANVVLSLIQLLLGEGTGSGSGGGRYSQLSLSLLFVSTSGQLVMFTTSMLGFAAIVRRREWGLDAVAFWIVVGFGIIGFSIVGNATDLPPQRIYSLLALFGLNIACAIGIITTRSSTDSNLVGPGIVVTLAILALSSPVAGVALSPYSDEIPTFRRYETAPNNAVEIWTDSYISDDKKFTTTGKATNIPVKQLNDGEVTTSIERTKIPSNSIYIHSNLAEKTGLLIDTDGVTLGSRTYAFVHSPTNSDLDNTVYSNGVGEVFIKR